MGTAIQHHVPHRVKPSFVIFDIQVRVHGRQKLQMTASTWSGTGCFIAVPTTHIATVGVKVLIIYSHQHVFSSGAKNVITHQILHQHWQ